MTRFIFDEFSQIPDKGKRYRERAKVKKKCIRCGQNNDRWPKTLCKRCCEFVRLACLRYQKGPRRTLGVRVLKLEHAYYELKLLMSQLEEKVK